MPRAMFVMTLVPFWDHESSILEVSGTLRYHSGVSGCQGRCQALTLLTFLTTLAAFGLPSGLPEQRKEFQRGSNECLWGTLCNIFRRKSECAESVRISGAISLISGRISGRPNPRSAAAGAVQTMFFHFDICFRNESAKHDL